MSQTVAWNPPDWLPEPACGVAQTLAEAGFGAWFVGEPLHEGFSGRRLQQVELATEAPLELLLLRFERAVPTTPEGWRLCIAIAGPVPVDLLRLRNGTQLEADLARRDFSVHAQALDAVSGEEIDPHAGGQDRRDGILRCVGAATARLSERPLRALRAARLVAVDGLVPTPELELALSKVASQLPHPLPWAGRRELLRALVAPHAGAALALLRRSGLEEALVPGAALDADGVIDALPRDPALRVAAWLRGEGFARRLARLRLDPGLARRVRELLVRHPLDANASPARPASLRRLARHLDAEDFAGLAALRRAELARADEDSSLALEQLQAVEEGVRAARIAQEGQPSERQLALDGQVVMRLLGWPPGPRVGLALRHLSTYVEHDASRNTPEILARELRSWAWAQAEDASA